MQGAKCWQLIFALFLLLGPLSQARADKLFSTKEGAFALQLDHDQGEFTLALTSGTQNKASKSESQVIDNPNRLVVDLYGLSAGKNYTYAIPSKAGVNQIRLGAHADKLRIVLDLEGGSTQILGENLTQGEFSIKFKIVPSAGQESAPVATSSATPSPAQSPTTALKAPQVLALNTRPSADSPTITPSIAPTPSAIATPPPSPVAAAASTPMAEPSSSPTKIPTASPTIAPKQAVKVESSAQTTGSSTLDAISFEYLGTDRVPVVKLSLSQLSQFKLVKKDDHTFEVSIPDSRLGTDTLSLPQFPPHDFIGFNLVQGRNEGGSVRVTIGVDRGLRVASVNKGNDILIRMLNR